MLGPGHALFHSPLGLLLLVASLGLMITVFSRLMFRAIGRLQRDVEGLSRIAARQNAQLRALNEANLALSQERLVSSVLQRVVDFSRELLQARYAALSIVGKDGEISVFLTSGMDEENREATGALPSGRGLLRQIMELDEPLNLTDVSAHPELGGFPPGHPVWGTLLGAPIRYGGQPVGSLYLTGKVGGVPFTAKDEEIVRLFANQAAVAIQNTRLYEQIQALAVETERSRISREMHDGLAQVLGYVNTKAQAVETFLEGGDVVAAQEQVRELSQTARQVYQDIREGILALRVQVGSGRNLQDTLQEYISEYEHYLSVPVTVH
jgi:nitrate/nitrite-specific signal transduction histidine kinase